MSSLEFAVVAAALFIVAVAAGWYLYTAFAATKQQVGGFGSAGGEGV